MKLRCFDPITGALCVGSLLFTWGMVAKSEADQDKYQKQRLHAAEVMCIQKNDCQEYRKIMKELKGLSGQ